MRLPRDMGSNPRSRQLISLMAAAPALYLFRQSGHSVIWVHLRTVHRPRTIFGFQPGLYVQPHTDLLVRYAQFFGVEIAEGAFVVLRLEPCAHFADKAARKGSIIEFRDHVCRTMFGILHGVGG